MSQIRIPSPPAGYAYVGCPTCGRVTTEPLDPDEAPPWCIHHDNRVSWREPHHEALDWTLMVRVRVEVTS